MESEQQKMQLMAYQQQLQVLKLIHTFDTRSDYHEIVTSLCPALCPALCLSRFLSRSLSAYALSYALTHHQFLQTVEMQLVQNPGSQELIELRNNLREYIELTKDLLGIVDVPARLCSSRSCFSVN